MEMEKKLSVYFDFLLRKWMREESYFDAVNRFERSLNERAVVNF